MYLDLVKIKDKILIKDRINILMELSDKKEYIFEIKTDCPYTPLKIEILKSKKNIKCLTQGDKVISIIKEEDLIDIRSEIIDDFYLSDFKNSYLKNINKRQSATKLGFKTVDESIGGLWIGKTYLIGAPSGHAKTIMLINLCKRVSIDLKVKSLYVDLELGRTRLFDRFSGILANFNVRKEAGKMDAYKKNILEKALENKNLKNIKVLDFSQRRIYKNELIKKMEKSVSEGVSVFFIDYIQNISTESNKDKKEELSEVSYDLRLFANKHDATVFIATQLNRGSSVCDIFEFNQDRVSDSIELVRDRDFMINIRKFQSDKEHHKGILECFIAKNREGEQKKFYLKFKEWTGLLEECDEPSELSEEEAEKIKAPASFFEEEIPNKFKD